MSVCISYSHSNSRAHSEIRERKNAPVPKPNCHSHKHTGTDTHTHACKNTGPPDPTSFCFERLKVFQIAYIFLSSGPAANNILTGEMKRQGRENRSPCMCVCVCAVEKGPTESK